MCEMKAIKRYRVAPSTSIASSVASPPPPALCCASVNEYRSRHGNEQQRRRRTTTGGRLRRFQLIDVAEDPVGGSVNIAVGGLERTHGLFEWGTGMS
jgi:hypothetical protein